MATKKTNTTKKTTSTKAKPKSTKVVKKTAPKKVEPQVTTDEVITESKVETPVETPKVEVSQVDKSNGEMEKYKETYDSTKELLQSLEFHNKDGLNDETIKELQNILVMIESGRYTNYLAQMSEKNIANVKLKNDNVKKWAVRLTVVIAILWFLFLIYEICF